MSFLSIDLVAREFPAKPAISYNGTIISYAAFASAISASSRYLSTQRLPAGETVVILIDNLFDCWVAVLALQEQGLNTVCVASTAIIDALGLNRVAGIVTSERELSRHSLEPGASTGNRIITIPAIVGGDGEAQWAPASAETAKIGGHTLYTSGTTGNYKKLFYSADLQQRREAERTDNSHGDTVCHCANFGLWTGVGYGLPQVIWHAKGCVVLDQRPDWHKYFLHSGLTDAVLIPDLVTQLLNALDELPLSSPPLDFNLHVPGGFLSQKLAEKLINRVTRNLIIAYGSSEANVATLEAKATDLDDLHWLPSTGYRTVEIVDEYDTLCPIDVEGQLRVLRTAFDSSSYVDDPQATEKVFRDGYFYPGDMAVRRGDGRIRILGRSADVVNFGGQKLAVAPIEHAIQNRLGVENVCLFSGINTEGEEELVIAIESERWPEKSDLNNLGLEFAKFDQVRFAIVYPFPRTQTGTSKIDRMGLRKLVFPLP